MAEKTEGATPPAASAESAPAPETQAPQPPAAARASEYLRERPRTRLFLIVAVLVLLVGIFFAWRYFSSGRREFQATRHSIDCPRGRDTLKIE